MIFEVGVSFFAKQIKEIEMPYARINMAEFESHEERQRTIGILRRDIKSVFPEIRAFVGVDLGEGSGLTISIYDDEAAAERAIANRTQHLKNKGIKDIFAHEGVIDCFYVEYDHLASLLNSGK